MKTKKWIVALLMVLGTGVQAQRADNIFIITTDGTRWQEVFTGADSTLLHDTRFVQDTALSCQLYWDASPAERRKKLMPFFWNVIARQGQLYGNREKESKVAVKNLYKISYPGYNELLTGYADPLPILNAPQYNRNISVLEYLNSLPAYRNSVAAFSSWNVFPFILNNKRNAMLQNSGYASLNDTAEGIRVINKVQDSILLKYKTRYDLLTFFTAKEFIRQHHPRVVFLGLGETDEFAHQGRYDLYLQQLASVDKMIAELWYLVQTDPFYKNSTTLLISTDHGRGRDEKWVKHHTFVRGSGEIWLALLGKSVLPVGEMQDVKTVYQSQGAATIALLLGETFQSNRKTAKPIVLPKEETWMAADKNAITPFLPAVPYTNEKE